jgi:hypothetical protein
MAWSIPASMSLAAITGVLLVGDIARVPDACKDKCGATATVETYSFRRNLFLGAVERIWWLARRGVFTPPEHRTTRAGDF